MSAAGSALPSAHNAISRDRLGAAVGGAVVKRVEGPADILGRVEQMQRQPQVAFPEGGVDPGLL
jgi:hypothetical protein